MLSLIQSQKRITPTKPQTYEEKAELKPLDALAAIAIRKHGIAAMVAKGYDGSENIQVLASTSSFNRRKELLTPAQPQHFHILSFRNPRNEDASPRQPTSELLPVVVDPGTKIPEALKDCKEDDLLTTYLESVW